MGQKAAYFSSSPSQDCPLGKPPNSLPKEEKEPKSSLVFGTKSFVRSGDVLSLALGFREAFAADFFGAWPAHKGQTSLPLLQVLLMALRDLLSAFRSTLGL